MFSDRLDLLCIGFNDESCCSCWRSPSFKSLPPMKCSSQSLAFKVIVRKNSGARVVIVFSARGRQSKPNKRPSNELFPALCDESALRENKLLKILYFLITLFPSKLFFYQLKHLLEVSTAAVTSCMGGLSLSPPYYYTKMIKNYLPDLRSQQFQAN